MFVAGRGWTRAGDITPGNAIRDKDLSPLTVLAVELDETPTRVHNLEIAEAHTYFAGELEAWGHNDIKDNKKAGDNFRDATFCALTNQGWPNLVREVYVRTPFGGRRIDIASSTTLPNGLPTEAIETKLNTATRCKKQRQKDDWLKSQGVKFWEIGGKN